jgi:predicted alpha/beta superfamily hydrolase
MKKFLLSFIAIFSLVHGQPLEKRVTFRVHPQTMPDTAKVYIAGNHAQLGNWQPDVVALTKENGGSWSRTFSFKSGEKIEYKFTRGSWDNEAVSAEGVVPPNSVLHVRNDTTIVVEIASWKDLRHKVEGQITGAVKYHRNMAGEGIRPRDVIVWLPPSYDSSQKRYPVLYMHDGQNVFDPRTSFMGVDWQADEVADSLIRTGKMEEIIIVGVNNSSDRTQDYSDTEKGRAYMKFLATTLKPFIDANYRTKPQREHTATMGSSMGGLISFLLVWHHPETFSQAGCLSPAFIAPFDGAVQMAKNDKGADKKIRIYMDNGGVALDSVLQSGCEAMLRALEQKGFKRGKNLEWFHDREAEHNEAAWARRLWRPMLFMFGRKAETER